MRRDPSDGWRGWKSATAALETFRVDFERETEEKFFLIADERDRASEISFYLHRLGGMPGHHEVGGGVRAVLKMQSAHPRRTASPDLEPRVGTADGG